MTKKTFPILAICVFTAMLGVGLIVPHLPLYAKEMGASGFQLGMIFAGYGITNTFLTPIMGGLSDRRGRKLLITIGLLFYTLLSLGYVMAASASHLILVRLLQGAGGAMIIPIAMAYIGDISPEGEEGKWMGYANAAFFSGFGVGPLLGGILIEHFSRKASFYSMGVLCLLAFLIAALSLPESRQRKMGERARPSFREMSSSPVLRGVFSLRLVEAVGRGGFMTFLPIFATTYAGLTPTLVGALISINMLSWMTLAAPLGRMADRFNRRTMAIIGGSIFLICLALIPLARNLWQLILVCIPQGVGSAMTMTSVTAMTVVEGRKFGMGSAMSVMMMAMGIGMAVGAPLSGVIADLTNVNFVFFFGATAGLIGTSLFAWFTR